MAYTEIDDPTLYFQTKLYTGTGSSNALTLDGDTDMQPDLVWIKRRNGVESHALFDSVRGVQKHLPSDDGSAEQTVSTSLTAFGSDGFTVGGWSRVNASSDTFVAWCWKESATAGFDIIAYTGNGTSGRTVSHNLSAIPECIIIFPRDQGDNRRVYHKGVDSSEPEDYHLQINGNDARSDNATMFNDTAPTSSVFSLGNNSGINGNNNTFIAYCFKAKQGFSKFGSYVGNGNADGTYIHLGFRPAMVIYKKSSGSGQGWVMNDNKRDTFNVADAVIYANTNEAESDYDSVDFLSNGFKHRSTGGSHNASGVTYIYLAFAEAPFVNSNGVPCNAR